MCIKLLNLFAFTKRNELQSKVLNSTPSTSTNSDSSKPKPIMVDFESIWSFDGRPHYVHDKTCPGMASLQIIDAQGNMLHTLYVDKPFNQIDVAQCIKGSSIPQGLYHISLSMAGIHRYLPLLVI